MRAARIVAGMDQLPSTGLLFSSHRSEAGRVEFLVQELRQALAAALRGYSWTALHRVARE
jgi:hypothetical protein